MTVRKPGAATRRAFVKGAAATVLVPTTAAAQQSAALGTPPSVISNPPRRWGRFADPDMYPDPDIIVIDPSFKSLLLGITAIHRVASRFRWAEGPAWSSEGQYLVFSDVQANTQYRYVWDDGRVTPFRKPSNNSNGNSFAGHDESGSCGISPSARREFQRSGRWCR